MQVAALPQGGFSTKVKLFMLHSLLLQCEITVFVAALKGELLASQKDLYSLFISK